ncbi:MAG: choice-of-anchor D domain-containing protein [Candidatus Marinimicrobia bacterium]|nr:choice-of-anchor D domain-containing protein [Candidatus Neomarinimicrobiota bacterium]
MGKTAKYFSTLLILISAIYSQPYTQIAAGGTQSLALGTDGKIYAWGSNEYGELGDGNGGVFGAADSAAVMVDMSGVLNGKTVDTLVAGFNTSYALTTDGKVYAWGANDYGQLGNGTGGFGEFSTTPVAVDMTGALDGLTVTQITSTGAHVIVLASNGKLYGWGGNLFGELGNASMNDSYSPVAVDMSGVLSGKTISKISAGFSHSLVLTSDDSLFAWGSNEFGQLGRGAPAGFDENTFAAYGSTVPVAVDMDHVLSGKTIVDMAAQGDHSLVIDNTGKAYAWGKNWDGELGDNNGGFDVLSFTGAEADTAVAVDMTQSLNGKIVGLVDAGAKHSLILASDGTLHAFGSAEVGQLGNGWISVDFSTVYADSSVAVDMSGVLNGKTVTAIAAGDLHNLVLTSEGKVYAWGSNWMGALGDGSLQDRSTPVEANGGVVPPEPVLVVNPAAVDFGEVTVGDSASLTIGVENAGTGTLHVDVPSIVGSGATQFSFDGGSFTIKSGMDTTLSIKFKPTTDGVFIAAFSLTSDGGNANVGLNGQGSIPEIPVIFTNPTSLHFSEVFIGDSTFQEVFIHNVGNAVLQVESMTVKGPDSTSFYIFTFDAQPTIAPADSAGLAIVFRPVKESGLSASLEIISDGGIANVSLAGVGVKPGPPIVMVSAGRNHSVALTDEGKVYAMGWNVFGQLGDASNTDSNIPVEVDTAGVLAGKTITDITTGQYTTTALSSEGEVYTWGQNDHGELGNNSTTHSNIPVAVDMTGVLSGKVITDIASGQYHTLALSDDGKLYAWGMNNEGQLGNGNKVDSSVPVEVDMTGLLSGKTIIAIAADGYSNLIQSSDGKLYTWGQGHVGQLGTGTTASSILPVAVDMTGALIGKTVTALACGVRHMMVATADGGLYAWGGGGLGELGDGNSSDSNVPVAVSDASGLAGKSIAAIGGGVGSSLALTGDGDLYAWGFNENGQLGDGTTTNRNVPVLISSNGDLAGKTGFAIASGFYHSLAVSTEGELYSWGWNDQGQLGNGSNTNSDISGYVFGGGLVLRPTLSVSVSDLEFEETLVGYSKTKEVIVQNTGRIDLHVNAPTISGNSTAQFQVATDPLIIEPGNSATLSVKFRPMAEGPYTAFLTLTSDGGADSVSITGAGKFISVVQQVAGGNSSIALDASGKLYGWGYGAHGELGNGSDAASNVPLAVTMDGALADKTIKSLAAASTHFVALTTDNQLYTWGYGRWGQIGAGDRNWSFTPKAVYMDGVLAGKTITAISGGLYHSLVLDSDGKVYGWGSNNVGQLGTGSTSQAVTVPVAVSTAGLLEGKTVEAIAAGFYHSIALASDNTLYTWGDNSVGQLGDGTTSSSLVPIAVTMDGALAGKAIVAIAAGLNYSLVLTGSGEVFAWGTNDKGQLGNGTSSNSSVPVAVTMDGALAGKLIRAITAGDAFALVQATDNTLYSWGDNSSGQLGAGSDVSFSNIPVAVSFGGKLGQNTVTTIAAAALYSVVSTDIGQVFAWGDNTWGQLGEHEDANINAPVFIFGGGLRPVSTEEYVGTPSAYKLYGNYPNPFNPTTTLRYELPEVADVSLTIYDIKGRMVSTMTELGQSAGTYEVQWHGTDDYGQPVSTGVYIARIQAGNYSNSIKMLYLK